MQLQILASSSKGNSYLLRSSRGHALVLEAGIKFSRFKQAAGYSLADIQAVCITHEHADHARAAANFAESCIPCYMSQGTAQALHLHESHMYRRLLPHQPAKAGPFTILPFDVRHDAAQPLGFIIHHPECGKLLFATDTAYIPYRFTGLSHILVECNYIPAILRQNLSKGHITAARYRRVVNTHLSLPRCIEALRANDLTGVSTLVLIHLSDQNTDEAQVRQSVLQATHLDPTIAAPGVTITLPPPP
ncbi:MAG: MBL fold metallo-hydrolase [Akkermansia sp.]